MAEEHAANLQLPRDQVELFKQVRKVYFIKEKQFKYDHERILQCNGKILIFPYSEKDFHAENTPDDQ